VWKGDINMKQPKKLTRKQKQLLSKKNLNPEQWMLREETEEYLMIQSKSDNSLRSIFKKAA
jgi:hypothetical protein